MKKLTSLIFLLLIIANIKVRSQGCSDAGFCTMGSLNYEEENDSLKLNSAKVIFSYGIGEQGTTIIQTIPEVNFSLVKNNTIQLRLPYLFINGNLGSNEGIGDWAFSITQTFVKKEKIKLNVTVGIKIASNHSDDLIGTVVTNELLPLPMPYQTSLGTNDLVLGTSLEYKRWYFGIGYQHVLANNNKNGFLRIKWSDYADSQKYFESNLLDRSDDALLRVERIFNIKKFSCTAGLIGIYRIQEDKISNFQNEEIDVNGSDGLTLNLTGSTQYNFSQNFGLNFSFGMPLKVREVRPDGLTRKIVLNTSLSYIF